MLDYCKYCPLYKELGDLSQYVPADEGFANIYMLVGQCPGETEVTKRKPFVGDAGLEQNRYLEAAYLSRSTAYVTNLVKCRPPKNRDPKQEEIEYCSYYLGEEIEEHTPRVIGAIGRFAARWFLGPEFSMEYGHGIPYSLEDYIVVPIYHPAAGLRDTTMMTLIAQDYIALGKTIRREITPRLWPPTITDIPICNSVPIGSPKLIALDTETEAGKPWCVTYTIDGKYAGLIKASEHDKLKLLNTIVSSPMTLTILHNALFDINILAQIGLYPARFHDTMSMAYLLQDLPLGLKPLAYRLLNMSLRKYSEVIWDAQQLKSLRYILSAQERTWPDPEPILVWEKGAPRVKKPRNINSKIKQILKKYSNDPNTDLQHAWSRIELTAGRGMVEEVLGPMPEAYLADIPYSIAEQYACADAIATYRLYPILLDRINSSSLSSVLHRDMGIIPIISDMQRTGIKINKQTFYNISIQLETTKEDIETSIQDIYQAQTGKYKIINPASPKQVAEALYELKIFRNKTMSTASEILDNYRNYPIINLITSWRELNKIQTTYTDPLPLRADAFDRVHTNLSITRTVTGRLASSKPNLQNIPVATDIGRLVRSGFVASEGCSLVSFDYSQIEMRVAAHMANDKKMIQMFLEGTDIHVYTASMMFGIPIAEVDKQKHRYPAKRVGFGVLYAMGARGLQTQMRAEGIEYSERACADMISAWYTIYLYIRDYMEEVKAYARRHGYVEDMFDRRRLVPEVKSAHTRIVNAGLRQAANAPIQSGAQGIIKEAMVLLTPVYREFQDMGYHCDPLLQIHDDLMFEISDDILDVAIPTIKSVMESAVELVVPTPVDAKIGKNWKEMK